MAAVSADSRAAGIESVVDRVLGFDEIQAAYRALESGAHQGTVVVSLS